MQLTADNEQLTDERVGRLIIVERIEGTDLTVTCTKSELVGNEGLSVEVEAESDNWLTEQMDDLVDGSSIDELMAQADLRELTLEMVQIPEDGPYFAAPPHQAVLRDVFTRNTDGEEAWQGVVMAYQQLLPSLGFPTMTDADETIRQQTVRPEPLFQPPASMGRAIVDGETKTLDTLRRRFRARPGTFSVADYKPTYLAKLAHYNHPDEKEMTWRI